MWRKHSPPWRRGRPTPDPGPLLRKRIIPCLDIAGGRVVKGVQFVDLVDAGDPVEAALRRPALVEEAARRFGCSTIVVAIDARRTGDHWECFTHGGRRPTGIDAIEWARRMSDAGAGEILLTSMDADGTKAGYDLALTRAVVDAVSANVVASGGVGSLRHLVDGLTIGGADAVLAASIFHFGAHTIAEAKEELMRCGIPVRMPAT